MDCAITLQGTPSPTAQHRLQSNCKPTAHELNTGHSNLEG